MAALTFLGAALVHVPASYCWIATKHFAFQTGLTDAELLTALIDHPQYADDYASAESRAGLSVHGPYELAAITRASFAPTTDTTARAFIERWATGAATHGPVSATKHDLEHFLASATPTINAAGATLYELLALGNEHHWDGNPIGWNSGFHEFIAINRNQATLALIVASDD